MPIVHPRRVRPHGRLDQPGDARRELHNFAQYVEPYVEHAEEHAAAAAKRAATEAERRGRGGAKPQEQRRGAPPREAAESSTPPSSRRSNHAEFHWWPNALTSLIIVATALVVSWVFCVALYTRKDRRLVGLTERVAPLRWGYTFLDNKYYLDALYENVIVHAVAHPIAKAANWVNQNVIDGIVNGVGVAGNGSASGPTATSTSGSSTAPSTASGFLAEETGEAAPAHAVRPGQPVRRAALRRRRRRSHRARDHQRMRTNRS